MPGEKYTASTPWISSSPAAAATISGRFLPNPAFAFSAPFRIPICPRSVPARWLRCIRPSMRSSDSPCWKRCSASRLCSLLSIPRLPKSLAMPPRVWILATRPPGSKPCAPPWPAPIGSPRCSQPACGGRLSSPGLEPPVLPERSMPKPPGDSAPNRKALFLSPEPPYPSIGGGPLRSASLLEYLAIRYSVDAILFRQPGDPDPAAGIPAGRVDRVLVLDLPAHRKDPLSRVARNLDRAMRGRPPLLDRFSGCSIPIGKFASQARYDVAIIEHFWCAPYRDALRPNCRRILIDLHNIESAWHRRLA